MAWLNVENVRMNIFKVSGMTCGNCVRHVTEALKPLPGVDSVEVDLPTGRVVVQGAADGPALIAALDEAGYPAETITDTSPSTARKGGCGSRGGCCCN